MNRCGGMYIQKSIVQCGAGTAWDSTVHGMVQYIMDVYSHFENVKVR